VVALVDCDVHCAPASLAALEPYLDPYWRDYAVNAGVELKGLRRAYPPATRSGPVPTEYALLREALLDAAPVELAVLSCLTMFEAHRHPYYAAALAAAVNDWLRSEWLDRDSRLRASLAVPVHSVELAVEEIRRAGDDPRFVQVLLPVRSEAPYGNPRFHPLLEAAAERGLVVAIHAWGPPGGAALPGGVARTYLEDVVSNQLIVQSHVLSLVSEGVFVRYPSLRVCLVECGFSWLPPLRWRFDKDWKGLVPEVPWVAERPSAYVRRHVRATTAPSSLPADPDEARRYLRLVGPELLVYASDFPSVHGAPPELLAELLGDDASAVLAGNARALYDRTAVPA